jgi:sugar lactone lactonase YvrE
LAFDPEGALYVADMGSRKIRENPVAVGKDRIGARQRKDAR